MTGRISVMSTSTTPGVIVTDDGASVRFDAEAVLPYELVCLRVGRPVTFEVARGRPPKAINVQPEFLKHEADRKVPRLIDLRFMGFDQKGCSREYRFEWIPAGESRHSYLVTGDMALFTRHHVRIQEGPALCLEVLMARLETEDAGSSMRRWSLTDADMLAHADCQKSSPRKPGPRST